MAGRTGSIRSSEGVPPGGVGVEEAESWVEPDGEACDAGFEFGELVRVVQQGVGRGDGVAG